MIDMHCHLDLYKNPIVLLPEVQRRCKYVLAVTTSPRAWQKTKQVFAGIDCIQVALGLHPEILSSKMNEIDMLLSNIRYCKYIGEVGIDGSSKYESSLMAQIELFREVVLTAEKCGGKVFSIHSRNAAKEVLNIIERNMTASTPILHHYEFLGDKLIIGKFCAIAEGVKFIMNGANHRMDGITTYPFNIFGCGWEKVTPTIEQLPFKGDTVIGNDVWIGQNVTIMPGVKVGDGAIIAANSTVVKNIEPYTIYGGNPAKFIKKRFSDEKVEFLLNLQWWNWDEEKIFNNLEMLTSETDNFWNEENLNERKQI
jgi:virginiamycin A acetyltransferase